MKKEKIKYLKWISKKGFTNNPLSLLWYYNRKNKAFKKGNTYIIKLKNKIYIPGDLFKIMFDI